MEDGFAKVMSVNAEAKNSNATNMCLMRTICTLAIAGRIPLHTPLASLIFYWLVLAPPESRGTAPAPFFPWAPLIHDMTIPPRPLLGNPCAVMQVARLDSHD